MLGTVGGVPIFGNAIREVASPNVGVSEVTVLFVEIVLPKVAFRANGVGTLELVIMSASQQQHLVFRRLLMLPLEEEEVAGNDLGTDPFFRLLLERIDESFSIVKSN